MLAPAATLATVGVLITTLLTAPVAKFVLGISWMQALLIGAVVASTDAAAVFLLINARGLRLRPRVRATLEVESGTNDPFAVFLTLLLVEFLLAGDHSWSHALVIFLRDTVLGCVIGVAGGRIITLVLNRLALPQGLHAPFVAVSALVVFASANVAHSSGFLAVYLAGLVVGNRQTRAHNSVVVFLDAVTWLAQIVMFVLLGLLVWPQRMGDSLAGSVVVALVLMLVARPVAVFLCLAPFGFQWREKLFVSWVGLRGAVAIFLASIPLLVGLPTAYLFFDVAFVVVLSSLLIQGWTVAYAARKLDMSFARSDPLPRRVELDLPGQLTREIVGYPVPANSPFLRRGLIPNWARPTLVVRNEEILTPAEADPVREGDYVYLLAPPEKAQALDRFFVNMPPPAAPDPRLLGDFFVPGDATLGALADIYGLQVAADHIDVTLADFFTEQLAPSGQDRRHRAARSDRAAGAQSRRWPRDHRGPAAGRAGRGGRSCGPAQVMVDAIAEVDRLARDPEKHALGLDPWVGTGFRIRSRAKFRVLPRAARQHRPVLYGPGAAEQHRGPEQIARDRVLQERQRGDVALGQTGEVEAVHPAEGPDREIRQGEEDERARHHDGNRCRNAGPAPRHDADKGRQRNRQGDDERNPPVVGTERQSAEHHGDDRHHRRERRDAQHAAGEQRAGGDRHEARRMRHQPCHHVQHDEEGHQAQIHPQVGAGFVGLHRGQVLMRFEFVPA